MKCLEPGIPANGLSFGLKSILYGESVLCRSKYVKVNKIKGSDQNLRILVASFLVG